MSMTPERVSYDAQKKKLEGLLEEHNLTYRFTKDQFPITLTISPASGVGAQMSMLEGVEVNGYCSPGASMTWRFQDGVLTTKVQGGTFEISKTVRQKIENILMKMIAFWQQYFFRDVMENNLLQGRPMPKIEDEATEDDDDPDGEEEGSDIPDGTPVDMDALFPNGDA